MTVGTVQILFCLAVMFGLGWIARDTVGDDS